MSDKESHATTILWLRRLQEIFGANDEEHEESTPKISHTPRSFHGVMDNSNTAFSIKMSTKLGPKLLGAAYYRSFRCLWMLEEVGIPYQYEVRTTQMKPCFVKPSSFVFDGTPTHNSEWFSPLPSSLHIRNLKLFLSTIHLGRFLSW